MFMFVEMVNELCKIKEGDVEDEHLYGDPVTLTRVKIEKYKLPRGFEIESIKCKITEIFGDCADFNINDFPGGFVFSYVERYPAPTDFYSVFPEERHVYQGLLKVFDIIL